MEVNRVLVASMQKGPIFGDCQFMHKTVVKLSGEVGRMLKIEAARRGVFMNDLVEQLVLAYLANEAQPTELDGASAANNRPKQQVAAARKKRRQ